MTIGILNSVGIVLVLALIIGVGLLSGRKVRSAADFTTGGGKSGSLLVCGAIMGSLVSSQATIGTAQLAFSYGLAAWWFTLGSGIGCLILALGYVRRLRSSGSITLLQIISKEYGSKAGYFGSVLCSIGIFISVLAQVVACCGLLTVILPVSTVAAAIISIALMSAYVIFGGAWGAGMGGVVKLILLYLAGVVGFVIVMAVCGGPGALLDSLRSVLVGTELGEPLGVTDAAGFSARYTNLIARGATKDIGSGLSLLLGVLATQTYAQAIWSGRSDASARRGALLSALLIPPLGIAGITIGLFMRSHYVTAAELAALGGTAPEGMGVIASTIQVFPAFVVNHMPVLLAGVVLGTLLITVVGGGAGLSLGVSTILVNDIYKKLSRRFDAPEKQLIANRLTILAVLAVSAVIACIVPSATINDFGFLSMGLRATVVFCPMTAALLLPGRIDPKCVLLSILTGPIVVIVGKLLSLPIDPLFPGLAVCVLWMVVGLLRGQRGPGEPLKNGAA